jgi:hypothetical protein
MDMMGGGDSNEVVDEENGYDDYGKVNMDELGEESNNENPFDLNKSLTNLGLIK